MSEIKGFASVRRNMEMHDKKNCLLKQNEHFFVFWIRLKSGEKTMDQKWYVLFFCYN